MSAVTISERLERMSMPVTECGCWIWLGAIGGRYGYVRVNGKTERTNRAAWRAFRGEIPAGLHVLHTCDIPICINPDHLFLGTHFDNMADKEAKGRGNHAAGERNGRHTKPWRTSRGTDHYAYKNPETQRGEKNPRAKLTKVDVLAIRLSTERSGSLVRRYGVTRTTINKIKRRELWQHL